MPDIIIANRTTEGEEKEVLLGSQIQSSTTLNDDGDITTYDTLPRGDLNVATDTFNYGVRVCFVGICVILLKIITVLQLKRPQLFTNFGVPGEVY